MQLEIYSPTADAIPEPIKWNYEELKKGLQEALSSYQGRVYTDKDIGSAKKDRAALNKLAKAIEDKRRELKNRCLELYQQFERQTNELIALVKEQSAAIDAQVKDFDSRRAAEKEEQIRAYYDTQHSETSLLIPYEQIRNPRWMNVTYDLKKVYADLDELAGRVRQDMTTINALDTPYLPQIRDKYLQTLSIGAALAERIRLEERDRQLTEYEAKKAKNVPQIPSIVPKKQLFDAETSENVPEEDVQVLDFRVWATTRQLRDLKQFLKENNIKYGKVV